MSACLQVVHMDMKPKNVLLTADYSIAKIADVGLAYIMGGTAQDSLAMGTFAYAAPEQLLNQACNEKVAFPALLSLPCSQSPTPPVSSLMWPPCTAQLEGPKADLSLP